MTGVTARRGLSDLLGRRYLFRVGGRGVSSYVVFLYLGCCVGLFAGTATAKSAGLDVSTDALATVVLLVPALVGARVLFVLQHPTMFREAQRRVWRRSDGGAALYGGLILSIAVSIPLLAAWRLPFWGFWDAASMTMLVGLIVTRVGCLIHGCCAGRVTPSRFGVWLPNHAGIWARRVPTQILEAGWATAILVATLLGRLSLFPGGRFAMVVAAYSAGRLILEPLREGDGARSSRWSNSWLSVVLLAGASAVLVAGAAG